jgi:multicomponent Na+:H+ antiporter subunit F
MAFVNAWLIAALALLPPLAGACFAAAWGQLPMRLAAIPLTGTLTVVILMLLAKAVDQPSFFDLPLALVLVSYPGTLLYTHFVERWL